MLGPLLRRTNCITVISNPALGPIKYPLSICIRTSGWYLNSNHSIYLFLDFGVVFRLESLNHTIQYQLTPIKSCSCIPTNLYLSDKEN